MDITKIKSDSKMLEEKYKYLRDIFRKGEFQHPSSTILEEVAQLYSLAKDFESYFEKNSFQNSLLNITNNKLILLQSYCLAIEIVDGFNDYTGLGDLVKRFLDSGLEFQSNFKNPFLPDNNSQINKQFILTIIISSNCYFRQGDSINFQIALDLLYKLENCGLTIPSGYRAMMQHLRGRIHFNLSAFIEADSCLLKSVMDYTKLIKLKYEKQQDNSGRFLLSRLANVYLAITYISFFQSDLQAMKKNLALASSIAASFKNNKLLQFVFEYLTVSAERAENSDDWRKLLEVQEKLDFIGKNIALIAPKSTFNANILIGQFLAFFYFAQILHKMNEEMADVSILKNKETMVEIDVKVLLKTAFNRLKDAQIFAPNNNLILSETYIYMAEYDLFNADLYFATQKTHSLYEIKKQLNEKDKEFFIDLKLKSALENAENALKNSLELSLYNSSALQERGNVYLKKAKLTFNLIEELNKNKKLDEDDRKTIKALNIKYSHYFNLALKDFNQSLDVNKNSNPRIQSVGLLRLCELYLIHTEDALVAENFFNQFQFIRSQIHHKYLLQNGETIELQLKKLKRSQLIVSYNSGEEINKDKLLGEVYNYVIYQLIREFAKQLKLKWSQDNLQIKLDEKTLNAYTVELKKELERKLKKSDTTVDKIIKKNPDFKEWFHELLKKE